MKSLLGYLILFWSSLAFAEVDLSTRLQSIISKNHFSKENLGIWIASTNEGKVRVLFELNSEKKFVPASLTKILTAGAVLEKLKPGFQFVTRLASESRHENGVLQGSIYLKGGGDPSFVSETMWFLVNEFVRQDIRVIKGDIIVDESRFDALRIDPSRDPARVDRAYDAPIGAMSFNWNSVSVYVRPGSKIGEPLHIHLDPKNDYVTLVNRATTSKPNSGKSLTVHRKFVQTGDEIVVTGTMALDQKETVYYRPISDPALWTGSNLKEFFNQRGIKVEGEIKKGTAPESTVILAEAPSRRLESIIDDMNKHSNNYIAEMLTKNLAVETGSSTGTIEKGVDQISNFIRNFGFSEKDFAIVNPSGLTRKNAVSPKMLGHILVHLREKFILAPEFISSLPIAGVGGTLKSRALPIRQIRAKTGMLNGVSGLAGYAEGTKGAPLVFVFLFNGPGSKTYAARDLLDQMAQVLVD